MTKTFRGTFRDLFFSHMHKSDVQKHNDNDAIIELYCGIVMLAFTVALCCKRTGCGTTNNKKVHTLLLDLPSESVGENIAHFIQFHCPLTIQANVPTASNFSMKQRVITSILVNFTLKV